MLVGNQLNYVRVNTALTADLLITATMVAPKTGVVTIYGVLTCSKLASFSYVTANLVQKTGRFTNDGSGSSQSLECVPEGTVWQLTIESENPFVGGRGDLSLRADAYAWPQFAQATYDGTVTLKGGHH
jgi:hypothetical protein